MDPKFAMLWYGAALLLWLLDALSPLITNSDSGWPRLRFVVLGLFCFGVPFFWAALKAA